jgi:hypothetical protein
MRPQRRANLARGVMLLARGRPEGFAEIGDTTQAFLASLAPLIAFPLVGAALSLVSGRVAGALADFLATLCVLLAPAVISHALARRWGREGAWLRFATAFNWCQWILPVLAAALLVLVSVLVAAGLPNEVAAVLMLLGLVAYGLWLHWFLARRGLGLSAGRAVLMVVAINVGSALLVLAPALLGSAIGGGALPAGGG